MPPTPANVPALLTVLLSSKNLSVTQAMRDHVATKARKLAHHSQHIVRLEMEINHEGSHQVCYIATGRLVLRGTDPVVHCQATEAYKAMDGVLVKLDRILQQHKQAYKARRHTNQAVG